MANLKKGSRGKDVLMVQKALIAAGIKPRVKADGVFGATTDEAVRAFQKKNRLKVDGIVGKKTMPKILKLAKGPKMDLKMTAPSYAALLKKKSSEFMKVKKEVLKTLVAINREKDPAIKKIAKEYNVTFQNFVGSHNRWRSYGEKIAKAQKEFSKELRRDPWSAQDIKKQIDADHASAHYENRCVEGSLFGFKHLDKMLAKTRRKMAA